MSSRSGRDPEDASFFSQEPQHGDPIISMPLRECSAEKEIVTPTRPVQHPLVSTPLTADQWSMINNIQNMRIMLSTVETIIVRKRFTVSQHVVLMRWQHAHLGPSFGHPDVARWLEANNIFREYAHDHTIIISTTARTPSSSRSRSRS